MLPSPRVHPETVATDKTLFRWNVEVECDPRVFLRALACAHAPTFFEAFAECQRVGEVPLRAAPHQREKTTARPSGATVPPSPGHVEKGMPPQSVVGFLTSGSTGEARVVWKSAECLLAEAGVLASRFYTQPGRVVTALVPPCHLFGFLFAGLAPALADMPVCAVEPGTPVERVPVSSVLVAVPSLFPYVEELLRAGRVQGVLLFSGAPLGLARREALRTLFKEHPGNQAFEILGSTESGGIGVSPVAVETHAFELLPGVHLNTRAVSPHVPNQNEKWELRSPFLFPSGSVLLLDDAMAPGPGGTFFHLGRSDRVFKYSGRRFSLAEIESRLVALSGATRCICSFQDDASHPKGGVLVAFLENPRSLSDLRRAWHASGATLHGTVPFPQEIHVLDSFPVDALGKVTLHALTREVNHGSRQQDV